LYLFVYLSTKPRQGDSEGSSLRVKLPTVTTSPHSKVDASAFNLRTQANLPAYIHTIF